MAVYYVRMTGNDTNNGTSPETAFRTIQKALNVVQPGDIIYVGAGNYDEILTAPNVGASETSYIQVIADRKGEFTGDKGDVVIGRRIRLGVRTTFNERMITANGSFYLFEGFIFAPSMTFFYANQSINGWKFRNCYIFVIRNTCTNSSTAKLGYLYFDNCVIFSPHFLVVIQYGGTADNDITFTNSLVIVSEYLFSRQVSGTNANVKLRNCFVLNLLGSSSASDLIVNIYDSLLISSGLNYSYSYNSVLIKTSGGTFSNCWRGAYVPFPVDFWRNKWLIMTDPLVRNLSDSNGTIEDIYGRPPVGTRDLGPIEYDYGEPVIGKKIFIKNTLRGGFTNK